MLWLPKYDDNVNTFPPFDHPVMPVISSYNFHHQLFFFFKSAKTSLALLPILTQNLMSLLCANKRMTYPVRVSRKRQLEHVQMYSRRNVILRSFQKLNYLIPIGYANAMHLYLIQFENYIYLKIIMLDYRPVFLNIFKQRQS